MESYIAFSSNRFINFNRF